MNNGIMKNYRIIFFILLIGIFLCNPLASAYGKEMSPSLSQVKREIFVQDALKLKGSPYVYGGVGPKSFDCSGFVYYVAKESIGVQLPRTARAMYNYCSIVTSKEREIGDLLFFKTNHSPHINHVGIYIGNNQFISALSDGTTPGVSVSSLTSSYWKKAYIATGKFLPKGVSEKQALGDDSRTSGKTNGSTSTNTSGNSKKKYFAVDGSLFADWTFFNPDKVNAVMRGVSGTGNIRLSKVPLQPGLGFSLRYNGGTSVFQIPLFLSLTLNDYVRFYGGPVFTFGSPKMPETGAALTKSIFPGIFGASFSTPVIEMGPVGLQLVQDLSYTVYKGSDNKLLSFKDSIYSGFLLNTGLRITFDF